MLRHRLLLACSTAIVATTVGCASHGNGNDLNTGADARPRTVVDHSTTGGASAAATRSTDERDIWKSDIDELNRYVHDKGLLGDVYFDYDDADLRADAQDRLARNARFLSEHPELVVTVEGHCDERGTTEYNLALGERRASSATSFLAAQGIAGQRLRRQSFGKEKPLCGESQESCWWRNRRAQFVLTGRTPG